MTPNVALSTIDPTPGPNDITSFEQAKAAAPAPQAPAEPRVPPPAAPSRPPREVKLSSPDPNRANVIPQEVSDDLDRLAGKGKAEPDKAEPKEEPTEAK